MSSRTERKRPEHVAERLNSMRQPEDEHHILMKMIPDFFEDRLSEQHLSWFLKHYDECADCRDEVSIQFLIYEGLSRLESGLPFNLQKELEEYLALERGRLRSRERFARIVFAAEGITVGIFAAAAVFFVQVLL